MSRSEYELGHGGPGGHGGGGGGGGHGGHGGHRPPYEEPDYEKPVEHPREPPDNYRYPDRDI